MGAFSMGRVRDKHVQYLWERRRDLRSLLDSLSDAERAALNQQLEQRWVGNRLNFGQVDADIRTMKVTR